uniref:NAD(P)-binding protein n=1 Tax=Kwoniella bestiolae CBS 10118 TaxID=1296100 RepID=A0A1B9G579_9TREE|nr:hypothetical protein I302_03867 [Kwoniella bestiolae CBS 10118]OCF26189.1 hypothetical protein I302_03867 [Kwoniella bestiolae CBS 10118]
MSDEPKTILITGANRGIGYELTKTFVNKGYKVIAAVRDLTKAPSIDGLTAVVKIDAKEDDYPLKAVEELRKKNIDSLDIVVANAGIGKDPKPVREMSISTYDEHHQVNARAPLLLFQAFYPLLMRKEGSKFVEISTGISQNGIEHMPNTGAYGASKAAINFITRQIHFEEPKLTAYMISPGWVDTDMGKAGATAAGLAEPPEKLSVTIRRSS